MEPARAEREPDAEAPLAAAPAFAAAPRGSPSAYALGLQRSVGNRATSAILRQSLRERDPDRMPPEAASFSQSAVSRPHPAYNAGVRHGRDADPEQPRGRLPFTAGGWNGQEISRRMGQLSMASTRTDAVSCVEASFLSELVVRGPDAVRSSIHGYVARYREQMTSGASRSLLRRLTRSVAVLESVVQSLDSQSMSYEQLATLQRHMYTVHGSGAHGSGTGDAAETTMAGHEGYTRVALNLTNVTQAQAAAQAALLTPGQFLSCGVDASDRGTGNVGHAIHIRRDRDGSLHLYDPWPRRGSQDTLLGADLAEMSEYFVGRNRRGTVARTFEIIARFSPPGP